MAPLLRQNSAMPPARRREPGSGKRACALGSLALVASAALGLWLFAEPAAAIGETSGAPLDNVDLAQFISPSLGATDGLWSDKLYRHPRLWVTVGGGARQGDGLVRSSTTQVQFGNVTATSTISGMALYGLVGAGDGKHPLIVGSATAIGNWSDISICLSPNCGDDGLADEAAATVDDSTGQSAGNRPGLRAISIIDGSTGQVTQEVIDTRTASSDGETAGAEDEPKDEEDAVEQQAVEEKDPVEDDGFEIELVLLPSFGAGIGAEDWWFPGMGGVNVYVSPEVLLLNRILVESDQLLVGDIVATTAAEDLVTEDVPVEQVAASELVEGGAVEPDLPDIVLSAVALGNSASMTSDSGGLAIDRQILVGSVDELAVLPVLAGGGIPQPGGGALSDTLMTMMAEGWISKAEIRAEASAKELAEALTHLNAVALANKHTIDGHDGLGDGNLLMADVTQFAYADMTAYAVVGPRKVWGGVDFSSAATAISNISEVSLAHVVD